MLGVQRRGQSKGKPVLRLVERRSRATLVPLIQRYVRRGSTIISDEWRAYNALPQLGYQHYTVNHSVAYVNPVTGAHTQHIERAWRTYKEKIWRLRGNRTEELLEDHLSVIEWEDWLARKHRHGPLGRLLHDMRARGWVRQGHFCLTALVLKRTFYCTDCLFSTKYVDKCVHCFSSILHWFPVLVLKSTLLYCTDGLFSKCLHLILKCSVRRKGVVHPRK